MNKNILSLNDNILTNLSIEELESRLEMQILRLPEAQVCYDCNCENNTGSYTENPPPKS
jgi:redox-regulated HSP33 family molecular chaperone